MTETEPAPSTGPVEDAPDTDGVRQGELDERRPRRRTSKWDRPAARRDWRWYVGTAGKVLIALGALMFGFVAYQLWGTGIETARAQRALEREFEELLASTPPPEVPDAVELPPATDPDPVVADPSDVGADVPDPDEAPAATDAPRPEDDPRSGADGLPEGDPRPADGTLEAPLPPELQQIPEVANGDALARIEIPAIGVDDIVVAGVEPADLKKGPGHYPDTPLPGQLGNAAIAGHRTTYGQPFHDVDDLEPGDEIIVTTLTGRFTYVVTGLQIVSPSDYQVVATTDPSAATLTLTSCHPKWSARERIVVSSELDPARSGPVGEPTVNYGRDLEPAADPAAPAPDPGDDADRDEEAPPSAGSVDTVDRTDGAGPDETADDEATDEATTGDGAADAGPDETATGDGAGEATTDETATGDGATAGAGEAAGSVSDDVADAFSQGWFSDPGAAPHVAGWGLLLAAIAIGAWLLSRRYRRDWVGALVGVAPFVVALYFFFQNVNRLLPPNL